MPTFKFSGGPFDGETLEFDSAEHLLELNGWFYVDAGVSESGAVRRMEWVRVPGGLTGPDPREEGGGLVRRMVSRWRQMLRPDH
ncbi:hypothetical protein [Pseudarthrobacter sp. NIBRBAC000502770]|uniref:hypothetical protein n=1 Tax=Pseudarthrobacter sp. NIBRBAC000502770 TaxID=2590785 RepID=UPI0011405EC8|nr:hypothetical protein [Pseudarthrobacter sp. NIBRBAC000502770]QDG88881.1 hypothetical protein NIBR502770_10625 [Pseudarthrobacter sp. NIBRBAC000502770]